MTTTQKTLLIEFSLSAQRTAQYTAARQLQLEVLYVGTPAPAARFQWEQIGMGRSGRPRNRLLQAIALRHALRHTAANHWVAVCPPASLIVPLAREADANDMPLTLWLKESDTVAWFCYLVARAFGYAAEALFLEDGWQAMVQQGIHTKEAA